MDKFTGQCLGGPDHGNLITTSVDKVEVVQQLRMFLDGIHDISAVVRQRTGIYKWNDVCSAFIWEGWRN